MRWVSHFASALCSRSARAHISLYLIYLCMYVSAHMFGTSFHAFTFHFVLCTSYFVTMKEKRSHRISEGKAGKISAISIERS